MGYRVNQLSIHVDSIGIEVLGFLFFSTSFFGFGFCFFLFFWSKSISTNVSLFV
jgi:hypothetical protein